MKENLLLIILILKTNIMTASEKKEIKKYPT